MSEFINTIDVLGDDAVTDSIIDQSITELKDDKIFSIGRYAFAECKTLTTIDFPSATEVNESAFRYCNALKTVNLSSATSIGGLAFEECKALETIDFPSATKVNESAFQFCYALKTVNLPSATSIGKTICQNCRELETVNLSSATSIGGYAFSGCSKLTTLILRNADTVCTLENANTLQNTPIKSGTGYIYVPAALVDSYKAASYWSTYASQFRALEDYTVDGTITGELDPNKI